MQTKRNIIETGNVLLYVLGAILVVSLIGAIVLRNSTTRLNVASNHVRAWKALSAAEAGGDIAFAEIRRHKAGSDPSTWWTSWINLERRISAR
jgi:Tfp pilus assembly protein PilX